MFFREIPRLRLDYYPEMELLPTELALSELSSLILRIDTLLLKGNFVVIVLIFYGWPSRADYCFLETFWVSDLFDLARLS